MSGLADTLSHSYIVHIRSKDCRQLTEGFVTDLEVSLDAEVKKSKPGQDIHVSLSSAEIPISWYAFSSNINNIAIYVDDAPSLAIAEGNYDVFELIALINADATFPYAATYNENTGRVTLTNTDAASHVINFSQADSRGLSKALGFERSDETVAAAGSTVSDGVVNFQSIHTVFLYSDLGASNVITTENRNLVNVIEKIPVLAQPFEVLHFNPYQTARFSTVLQASAISNFRLSLRDQNGVLVQLNGTRYELSLLFEIHDKGAAEALPAPASGRRSMVRPEPINTTITPVIDSLPAPIPTMPVATMPVPMPTPISLPKVPQPMPAPLIQAPPPAPVAPVVATVSPDTESKTPSPDTAQQSELTDALLLAASLDLE